MGEACSGCGAVVLGGTSGCHALFEALRLKELEDHRFGRHHNEVVDTYCLQHPDRYCASGKSLAAHLIGQCGTLEHGGDLAVREAMQRWLNGSGPASLAKPALPTRRGDLTILDVKDVGEPEEFGAAVRRWTMSTWDAYEPLHPLARRWLHEAVTGAGRGRLSE